MDDDHELITGLGNAITNTLRELEQLREENVHLRSTNSRQATDIADLRKALEESNAVRAKQVETNSGDELHKKSVAGKAPTFTYLISERDGVKRRMSSFSGTDVPKRRRLESDGESSFNPTNAKICVLSNNDTDCSSDQETLTDPVSDQPEQENDDEQERISVDMDEPVLASQQCSQPKVRVPPLAEGVCKYSDEEVSDSNDELDFDKSPQSPIRLGIDKYSNGGDNAEKTEHEGRDQREVSKRKLCKNPASHGYCYQGDMNPKGEKCSSRGTPAGRQGLSDSDRSSKHSHRNPTPRRDKCSSSRVAPKEYKPLKPVVKVHFKELPSHITNKMLLGALRNHLGEKIRLRNRITIVDGCTFLLFKDEDLARKLLKTLPFTVFDKKIKVYGQKNIRSLSQESIGGSRLYLSNLPPRATTKILLGALSSHLKVERLDLKNRVYLTNGCAVVWFRNSDMARKLLNSRPFSLFKRVVNISRSPCDRRDLCNLDLSDLPYIRDTPLKRHKMKRERYHKML